MNEFLGPRAAGESDPCRAAFAVEAEVDIEEGATEVLTADPFRDQVEGCAVAGKLKFIAVSHFAGLEHKRAEAWSEFIEVAMAFLGSQRHAVAGERGWMSGGGQDRQRRESNEEFRHEPTLRLEADFKSMPNSGLGAAAAYNRH